MDTTSTIASLIGLYFIAVGLGLLVDRDLFSTAIKQLIDQPMLGYFGGILAFAIGGAIVGTHNNWSTVLSGFVSFIGWIALAEGMLILALRRWFLGLFSHFVPSRNVVTGFGAGTMVLGIIVVLAAVSS